MVREDGALEDQLDLASTGKRMGRRIERSMRHLLKPVFCVGGATFETIAFRGLTVGFEMQMYIRPLYTRMTPCLLSTYAQL